MNKYEIVIGLEIHAELSTKTKAFCGCANEFGSAPNTNCCPVCVGFPGALPVYNRAAMEKGILAGLAFGCEINKVSIFERKNYFYPDLAKAYQLSQLVRPTCIGGEVKLKSGKVIRLNRIHLEEDAGKLLHNDVTQKTLVDYNRSSVPLVEMVTEPDISSAAEAVEFLEEVRSRLVYAGVADCKMEQGGMRCDVNLSLRPTGTKKFGSRTEMKNLNSFRSVARAIEHESKRQAEVLDAGGAVTQETRKWDDTKGKTSAMRSKEEAQDYRYFPDPDLIAIKVTPAEVAAIKIKLPVLAYQLKNKFMTEFGLPEYDADVLTREKAIAFYFLDCVKAYNSPKQISNWIMVDLMKIMNAAGEDAPIPISAAHFTEIIKMTEDKTITKLVGLQLLEKVISTKQSPGELAKTMGLLVTVTEQQIVAILEQLKAEKPTIAADYRENPERVIRFMIGYVMKNTQGRAKSDLVEKLIKEKF